MAATGSATGTMYAGGGGRGRPLSTIQLISPDKTGEEGDEEGEEEKQDEKEQKEHDEKKKLCDERRYIMTLGRMKINGSESFWAVRTRPSGTYSLEAR